MKNISLKIKKFIRDEDGLTTVEYAVAGALVAAALVTAFTDLGVAVQDRLKQLASEIK